MLSNGWVSREILGQETFLGGFQSGVVLMYSHDSILLILLPCVFL